MIVCESGQIPRWTSNNKTMLTHGGAKFVVLICSSSHRIVIIIIIIIIICYIIIPPRPGSPRGHRLLRLRALGCFFLGRWPTCQRPRRRLSTTTAATTTMYELRRRRRSNDDAGKRRSKDITRRYANDDVAEIRCLKHAFCLDSLYLCHAQKSSSEYEFYCVLYKIQHVYSKSQQQQI